MPPKIHVTHPSIDASTSSAVPRNPDPTLLLPKDPRQIKPPNGKDLKRQEANKNSGLVGCLNNHNIPTNHERFYVSQNEQTTLTASNVQLADLRKYYKWEFYSSMAALEKASVNALDEIIPFEDLHSIESTNLPVLQLPDDWQKPQDPTLMLLKAQLAMLPSKARREYTFSKRKKVEGIEYPYPNVTLHEAQKDDPEAALRVEWTLVKVLAFPRLDTYRSELEVERHIGSNLAGFFNIDNCTTSSNTDVAFPTAVGCFGSFPRPDFACRLNPRQRSPMHAIPWSFRPVVLAGEAKRDNTSILPTKDAHTYRMAAQLACTVQPTLVLLITDAIYKWEKARKTNPKEPFRFPFRSIIHGIAYDGNGVIIYGFFPRLIASHPNGKPSEWGFGCTVVTTEFTEVFGATPAIRVKFITAMLIIQRHATYLSEELQKGLLFMKVHEACDKLWEERHLGCH